VIRERRLAGRAIRKRRRQAAEIIVRARRYGVELTPWQAFVMTEPIVYGPIVLESGRSTNYFMSFRATQMVYYPVLSRRDFVLAHG
jgi:hypothetical protein